MGSFSETLIDLKDLRHDNKQVYYCIYTAYILLYIYYCIYTIQSTVGKKNNNNNNTRSCFVFLLMESPNAFLLVF